MGYYLNETELYYFNAGTSACAYESLGVHKVTRGKKSAWRFAVWAPNAHAVSVIGTFNEWNSYSHAMFPIGATGVWQCHIPEAKQGDLYKYAITTPSGDVAFKADPYAVRSELRPGTASMVWEHGDFTWTDEKHYERFDKYPNQFVRPMSIYEVHLGSFRDGVDDFKDMAMQVVDHAADMGYTHIELMPIMEHPLDMSWGYQVTGYYSVTSRFGTPEDLKFFVNRAHKKGLSVILDWVGAHFPRDAHGLRMFDGTPIYEHPDPLRGEQPQWGTMLFDYGRTQVRSFLMSNIFYWLKEYHFDGIRVDAVSCMLYLDYGKEDSEWSANEYGGNENLDAIAFLRDMCKRVGLELPHRILIAEESTAFPLITMPPEEGGLGFHFKWNMGFMNDILEYISMDSLFRKWHHNKLTFSMFYAFSENYILPFSHDEVVHGKHSIIDRAPGDYWSKFAQTRLLYSYQYAHPGKKLNFMGNEFGQFIEWDYAKGLDWLLLEYPAHVQMKNYVKALNAMYKRYGALYEKDNSWDGFEWVTVNDSVHSVASFIRYGNGKKAMLCVFNFTPVPWPEYKMGMPFHAELSPVLSSDDPEYGGTGDWMNSTLSTVDGEWDGKAQHVNITLPPMGAAFFSIKQTKSKGSAANPDGDITGCI